MCFSMAMAEDKEAKTKQKQESTKTRIGKRFACFSGGVWCLLACSHYCLIANVALLIFFVRRKQKKSHVYEHTHTQTHTNASRHADDEQTVWHVRGAIADRSGVK